MKYRFYGRLFPYLDICNINCTEFNCSTEAGIELKGKFNINDSQCEAEVDSNSTDVLTIRNHLEQALGTYIDCIGYLYSQHCEIFLDQVSIDGGELTRVYSYHPTIHQEQFKRSLTDRPKELIRLAEEHSSLRESLVSIKHATRIHERTGMYAFRAIEAVRDYFDEDWQNLNSALNTHRSWADEVALFAKPQRHGATRWMSADDRTTLLQRAYAVVDRFILFLASGKQPIKNLAELFCDGKGTHSPCLDLTNKNHKV